MRRKAAQRSLHRRRVSLCGHQLAQRAGMSGPELDRILLQCLSKKPEDRPRDPATLAKMLEAVPARDCWTKERADHWWETHLPAAAPSTTLREATPVGSVHAAK